MSAVAPEAGPRGRAVGAFSLRLDNFEGPFDLLLSLISKHKLDVTEVALSQVTDEFIAHIKAAGEVWDLEQTTSFLLVASTLLDLKAARLLPQGEVDDEEDLVAARGPRPAVRAAAAVQGVQAGGRHPRAADARRGAPAPAVGRAGGALRDAAARRADRARPRRSSPGWPRRRWSPSRCLEVGLAHLHAPAVSVREQATIVVGRLRGSGTLTFRALAADAPDTMTRVARFLALLELFREGVIAFDQMTPLGELSIRWTGTDDTEVEITDEFDGAPPHDAAPPPTRRHHDRHDLRPLRRDRHPRGAAGRAAPGPRGRADGRRPAAGRVDPGHRGRSPRSPRCGRRSTSSRADYDESGRGFELRNVAGGWRYYTREALAPVVERFVLDGQQARLTQAALETLAVVAYKQPVSRSRVSAIRGVNVDGVMRTLLTRGLVEEAGTDHETGAHLYRTTSYFLERIGVTSLDDLPELAPFLPGIDDFDDEQEVPVAVAPEGAAETETETSRDRGRDRDRLSSVRRPARTPPRAASRRRGSGAREAATGRGRRPR